jgi:hypothetical protein
MTVTVTCRRTVVKVLRSARNILRASATRLVLGSSNNSGGILPPKS